MHGYGCPPGRQMHIWVQPETYLTASKTGKTVMAIVFGLLKQHIKYRFISLPVFQRRDVSKRRITWCLEFCLLGCQSLVILLHCSKSPMLSQSFSFGKRTWRPLVSWVAFSSSLFRVCIASQSGSGSTLGLSAGGGVLTLFGAFSNSFTVAQRSLQEDGEL